MPAKNLLQSIQEHVGKRTLAERPFDILQTNVPLVLLIWKSTLCQKVTVHKDRKPP